MATKPAPLTVTVKGSRLIIDAPLEPARPSAFGKTLVVASTHGNVATEATVDGQTLIIGLNVYYRA